MMTRTTTAAALASVAEQLGLEVSALEEEALDRGTLIEADTREELGARAPAPAPGASSSGPSIIITDEHGDRVVTLEAAAPTAPLSTATNSRPTGGPRTTSRAIEIGGRFVPCKVHSY